MNVCVLLVCINGVAVVDSCPTWFSNTTGSCKCGSELNGYVKCYQDILRVDIMVGHCLTLFNNYSVVGGLCQHAFASNITDRVYSSVPDDPAQLASHFCSPYNRSGFLCGECSDEFGPSPFYSDFCASCSDLNLGAAVCLYLFIVLFPATVFFIIILAFNLNVTTGPLLGYIICCQSHVITLADNFYFISSITSYLPSPLSFIFHSSLFFSSLWTLKFFQFNIPPFCISSKMTGIHVHMLSYIATFYLLFLIILTYLIMDCNVHFLHLPRPAKIVHNYILTKLSHTFTSKNSVVHAFATFIFLAMSGILYETFCIIAGDDVYHINSSVAVTVLRNDPTIIKYSDIHLPYMICTLVILFFLVFCPSVILCIYPTRVYERLSRHVSPRKRLVVKIFAETFHSCFKDGLDGTTDYRMIPSAIILLSMLVFIMPSLVHGCIYSLANISYATLIGCTCVVLSLIISYLRPCKSLIMNMSLSFHTTVMGLSGILLGLWKQNFLISTEAVAIGLTILLLLPHAAIMMWAAYNIVSQMQSQNLCNLHNLKIKYFTLKLFRKNCHQYEEVDAGSNNNSQQLLIH